MAGNKPTAIIRLLLVSLLLATFTIRWIEILLLLLIIAEGRHHLPINNDNGSRILLLLMRTGQHPCRTMST